MVTCLIFVVAKHDIVLESQLPQGMSGEKLKDLEQGHVTEVVPEEKPQVPPKFLYEVCDNLVLEWSWKRNIFI